MLLAICLLGCNKSKQTAPMFLSFDEISEKDSLLFYLQPTIKQPFTSISADDVIFTLNFGEKQNLQSKGSIRILCDSLVCVSLQPMLGIEMFRLECTHQNITLFDKMNHRYVALPAVSQEVNYYDYVESFLLKYLFFAQDKSNWVIPKNAIVYEGEKQDTVAATADNLTYQYVFNRQNYMLEKARISLDKNIFVEVAYNDLDKNKTKYSATIATFINNFSANFTATIAHVKVNKDINYKPIHNLHQYDAIPLSALF